MSELTDLLSRSSMEDRSSLLWTVNEIVEQGYLTEFISKIIHGDLPDEAFVPEAYLHPNGFIKFRLAKAANGQVLRLHVWDDFFTQSDIHSHRWDFASRIIAGTVVESQYKSTASDEGGWVQYDCSRDPAGNYLLKAAGRYEVEIAERREYGQDSSYFCDHRHLHHIATGEVYPVITLMIQTRPKASSTKVLSPHQIAKEKESIDRLDGPHLRNALRRVIGKLQGGGRQ